MPRHTFEDRGGVEVKGKVGVLTVEHDSGPEKSFSVAITCVFVISYRFPFISAASASYHSYRGII